LFDFSLRLRVFRGSSEFKCTRHIFVSFVFFVVKKSRVFRGKKSRGFRGSNIMGGGLLSKERSAVIGEPRMEQGR